MVVPARRAAATFAGLLAARDLARGRGLGHWLIESAFQHAYRAGLPYAASIATPISRKFLVRFGFRPATHFLEQEAQRHMERRQRADPRDERVRGRKTVTVTDAFNGSTGGLG